MLTRRDAMKRFGGLAGAAALARFVPGCSTSKNVPNHPVYVYMMLENRTYDHYFGARSMLEGKPGDGLTADMMNPDMDGDMVAPFKVDPSVECVNDPDHSWEGSHAQWNNGKNDGFVRAQEQNYGRGSREPMQYYTRDMLPVSWALADNYATCDRWFASVMGPTIPNRAYWHVATSAGLNSNQAILDMFASLPVPSIYNRLHDADVDWAYYYGNLPVVSAIQSTGQYALDLGPTDGTGNIRRFEFFLKDAAAGRLPPVCYIDPVFGGGGNDDHPPHHPIDGQELILTVYQALATSPQWKHLVMMVVTYDEHGGFFDHVSPPTTTDDTLQKYGVDGFQQMGFRVPAMVIGPYVKPGYVSSVVYDHTSALKQLQNAFGFSALNVRMDAANDLSDCLDMGRLAKGHANSPIALPFVDPTDTTMWPRTPLCSTGGLRTAPPDCPICEWADTRPKMFGTLDERARNAEVRKLIRDYLSR
jgi:phospholipase C